MNDLTRLITPFPSWINIDDVTIWHDVTLMRNIAKRTFPVATDIEELKILFTYFNETVDSIFPEYELFSMENSDIKERKYLEERFLIDNYILSNPLATGIVFDFLHSKGIMLNSYSHFKFFSINAGLLNEDIFRSLMLDASMIETIYPYSFTQRFGYLNPYPENCGTGIILTYYMRLPGFMFFGRTPELKDILKSYDLSIAPYTTDEKNLMGTGIFKISNNHSYAHTFDSLIKKINLGIEHILEKEYDLRKKITEESLKSIEDKIMKTIGMLKFANSIGNIEFGASLFSLFLGAELKLIPLLQSEILKTYFSLGQAYLNLKIEENGEFNLSEFRAQELQKLLRNI